MEIFPKTGGLTFYFQSPPPYLCTCTITIDAIRKDLVEERNRRDKWEKETSSVKFWKCAIYYCNFVSVKWNDKGTFIPKGWVWHIKLEYAKKWYGNQGTVFPLVNQLVWHQKKDCSSCRTTETENVGSAIVFCRLDCAIKMGPRDMAIKVSRCQHGKKKKSPWLYSLEEFQGILPRIFPCRAIVGES